MKKLLLLPLLLVCFLADAQIMVDTHNDVLSNILITKVDLGKLQHTGNFDLVRAKQGGQNAQVFSVWCGEQYGNGSAFKMANREIDSLYALIKRYPTRITLVRNTAQLKQAVAKHQFAALIGVEGGHMIENRLDYIDALVKRGMCYLTLTWNNSTDWATSARDETLHRDSLKHIGLTNFGKQVVHRLNDRGVMIDVSHVGEKTFYDIIATTKKPIIASHSCAYTLDPHRRNLKDAQLKALAKNGGVVFINFYSNFLDSNYLRKDEPFMRSHKHQLDSLMALCHDEDMANMRLHTIYKNLTDAYRPPLNLLIKHIDYIVKLIGIDHVGIGSDFDGSESFPLGMDSVADYPKIFAALRKIGYSETDINKIKGGNFMRVLLANTGR